MVTRKKSPSSPGLLFKPEYPVDWSTFYDITPIRSPDPQPIVAPQGQQYDTIGAENVAAAGGGNTSGSYQINVLTQRLLVKVVDMAALVYSGTPILFLVKFKIRRNNRTLFYFHMYLSPEQTVWNQTVPMPEIILEVGDELLTEFATSSVAGFSYRYSMQVQGILL